MDMVAPFANTMVLNSDQSQSAVKQDYIWSAFAPNHTSLVALDIQSDPSLSTSVTSSPRLFSNQVSSNHETLFGITREIVTGWPLLLKFNDI